MNRWLLAGLALTFAAPAGAQSRLLRIEVRKHIVIDPHVGQALQVVPVADGTFLVADYGDGLIRRLDREGRILTSIGGRGAGPGEFRSLYRIAVGEGGRIYALDASPATVSVFTPDGRFLWRRELSLALKAIGGFLALPSGGVAVSGAAARAGILSDSAVHLFDDSLRHVRSFAPVPRVENADVLQWWGTGGISLTPEGRLLFTRKLPFEVYEYSEAGRRGRTFEAPFADLGRPDQAIHVVRTAQSTDVTRLPGAVSIPITAHQLGNGTILTGRLFRDSTTFDLFSADGTLIASSPRTRSFAVIGRGTGPNSVWAASLASEEPAIELWVIEVKSTEGR